MSQSAALWPLIGVFAVILVVMVVIAVIAVAKEEQYNLFSVSIYNTINFLGLECLVEVSP